MLTFADLIDHVLAFAGKDATEAATADYRRASINAYRAIATRHPWFTYYDITRVNTNAAQTTGTIEYDYTGGTYERMVTLTGATWPSWTLYGYIIIGNIPYEVEAVKSSTVVTLTAATAPTSDIAALTGYVLARDTYTLPANYLRSDETIINEIGTVMEFGHPRSWSSARRLTTGPGRPVLFTITKDPDLTDRMCVRMWPPPDTAYSMDMLYHRKPRALVFDKVTDGLVSTSTTTVTGVDTRFKSLHVGSAIRFGADADAIPTGVEGSNPYFEERTITAFTSETSITIDSALSSEVSGVKYCITDPVDIDTSVMQEYLLREIERQHRIATRAKPLPFEEDAYKLSFVQAMEADDRYSGRKAAMRQQAKRTSLKYYPLDLST